MKLRIVTKLSFELIRNGALKCQSSIVETFYSTNVISVAIN